MGSARRDKLLLARSLSAKESSCIGAALGRRQLPPELYRDDRPQVESTGKHPPQETMERKVFEKGKDKWPTLHADDAEARAHAQLHYGQPSPNPPSPKDTPTGAEAATLRNRCSVFKPQSIGFLVIGKERQPSEKCVKEMTAWGAAEAIEREWQKLVEEKLKHLKTVCRELPYCPEHGGQWSNGRTLSAVLVPIRMVDGNIAGWTRQLWWVCLHRSEAE
jgi:hypothetical protein